MNFRKPAALLLCMLLLICCFACGKSAGGQTGPDSGTQQEETADIVPGTEDPNGGAQVEKTLQLIIGDTQVKVEWEDNESVEALKKLASEGEIVIEMSMYGGFEQVGDIGVSLPRNDRQTVTSPGDIVLYSGDSIVIFYGSNSWSYTVLGRITDKTAAEMEGLLGRGDVTVTIYLGE
ncbi:MAG: hypothetical protein J6S47_06195 [Eubacteriaceae bacterium]|nr:hypothetical protein [Eubacteriaceae bacterium]